MPRYFLRSVDPADPRPCFSDEKTMATAIDLIAPAVVEWARSRTLPLNEEHVRNAVLASVRHAGVDAFRIGVILQASFDWPVDFTLVTLFDRMVEALPATLRHLTNEWVVRTGLRFPAKEGDTIEYVTPRGEPVVGIVKGVLKAQARAFVQQTTGDLEEGEPISIPAEAVVANVSQALYEPQRPALGLRYIDAPRLGALSEAARKKNPVAPPDAAAAPKMTHPLAGLNDFDPSGPLIA